MFGKSHGQCVFVSKIVMAYLGGSNKRTNSLAHRQHEKHPRPSRAIPRNHTSELRCMAYDVAICQKHTYGYTIHRSSDVWLERSDIWLALRCMVHPYIGVWSIHGSSGVQTCIPTNWYDYTLPNLGTLVWIKD